MPHDDARDPLPADDAELYPDARAALEALRPTLEALPRERVHAFRARVSRAVPHALRLARSYRQDRARFVETFKRAVFEPERYDDIELRALALWAAEADLRVLLDAERKLPSLIAEATPVRQKLLRAAEYLWGSEPRTAARVAAIRAGSGYADLADDLNNLVALFESELAYALANSAVRKADLAQARRLSVAIARLLDGDDPSDSSVNNRRELRDRAGSYLTEGINEVRRAAAYIFHHTPERLEAYPSLFAYFANAAKHSKVAAPTEQPTSTSEPELEPA